MNHKKHVFIVNAFAGSGKSLHAANNIKKYCSDNNIDADIIYTKESGEATQIAARYTNSIIFSVGGDGTLSEVVNGIVGTDNLLGIVPTGSGNDFYKTIAQLDDELLNIDLAKINDRYFINVACIGIDAEIAKNAELMKSKKIPASQKYNASIFYTFFQYKCREIEFYLHEIRNKGKFTIVTICNGQYYGGGYRIAPKALITDHQLDVYFVDYMKKRQMPSLILKLRKGIHEQSPKVHKEQTDKIMIRSEDDIICNIDGETIISKQFDIQLVRDALTLYHNKSLIKAFLI